MKKAPAPLKQLSLGSFVRSSLALFTFTLSFNTIQAQLQPGDIVGIDFGATSPSDSANTWNHLSVGGNANTPGLEDNGVAPNSVTLSSLVTTENEALSNVTFTFENNSDQIAWDFTGGVVGNNLFTDPSVYGDAIISNDASGRAVQALVDTFVLTFSNLNDSLKYNLVGGWDSNNANFEAIWSADGQSFQTIPSGSIGYDSLTDLSTDGSGNLVITVSASTANAAAHITVAGLTLEAVSQVNPDGSLNFPLDTPEGGYSFPNAFPGVSFTDNNTWITGLESLPGHPEKLFVIVSNGRVWMIPDVNAANPTKVLILDRSSVDGLGYFNGMGGVAFHPDFDNNGYLYVTYPGSTGGWTRVSRFTVADPTNIGLIDNATEQVLIEDNFHRAHGFNRLLFGPDGYLYIPVGDGKQVGTQNRPASRITQTIDEGFWSSILRIDVDKLPGNFEPQNLSSNDANGKWTVPTTGGLAHYSIPADNPFLSTANDGTGISTYYGKAADPLKVRTEMYAIGFRNPWKMGFVPGTNDIWVADVMNAKKERYLIVPKGGNAGWAFFSGTGDVEYLQSEPTVTFPTGQQWIQPVVEYYVTDSGSGANNKSIIGGEFYQSNAIPSLTGAFLMCDYNRGDIWAIHRTDHSDFQMVDAVDVGGGEYALDDTGMSETTVNSVFAFSSYNSTIELLGVEGGITAMLPNPTTGEMLLADSDNKIIRKLVFTPGDIDSQLPQTLAETGVFTDVPTLAVNPEMKPYDLNLPFWSDGALKSRWFNMVDTTEPMTYSRDDFWEFPANMVTMKHFEMDLDRDNPGTNVKRIETRFIVKTDDDFYAISYQWNPAGTEATLAPSEGVNLDLSITEGGSTSILPWRIPSRAECAQCHTHNNNIMLGLNTRQLNRDGALDGTTGNLLSLLETAGYLSTIGESPSTLPKHLAPSDTLANLEERAQSYLAVNCAYCHFDGNGLVPNSWRGEAHLSIEETNLLHGEAIGFQVIDDTDRLIIPGDPANSIILSRTSETNGYGRMPPIATSIIDPEGVALLTDWINNYANAKPSFPSPVNTRSVSENSPTSTEVGVSLGANDPDYPENTRGLLTYSIIDGNEDGYFDIDPTTGQITLTQKGPDFEETMSFQLTVHATDGFVANPGEATTNVTVNIDDIPNDDSQGDGITDEWAMNFFNVSAIDPSADFDNDGYAELLEFWADSDPTDSSDLGFIIEPAGVVSDPGNEGYLFEWEIRSDLVMGQDYFIQGSNDLSFADLVEITEYELVSTTPVDAVGSKVQIKVSTAADRYFLRLRSPISAN